MNPVYSITFVSKLETMKKHKANKHQLAVQFMLVSVLCGCDGPAGVHENPLYQTAADRYRVSDSNAANISDEPAPLASTANMASVNANRSTSPSENLGSTVLPAVTADPLTQQRIADLESTVEDLQSQLEQRASGGTTQGNSPTPLSGSDRDLAVSPRNEIESEFDSGSAYRHRFARSEVDRLVRAYKRARTEVSQSDVSYKLDHMMTLFKGFELLLHDTPQTFNPLPERDRYAFRNFQEAAEDLVAALEDYLDEFGSGVSNDTTELKAILAEAREVIEMSPPGTGNRMLDFIQELETNLENQQKRNNE